MHCIILGYSVLYYCAQIGMTPLLWASWFGHVDVLQQLVNNGANVHATNLVRYVTLRYTMPYIICSHSFTL